MITSRIDAGLGPYVPPSMAGTEIIEESLTDEEAEVELQAISELKEEQDSVDEESDEGSDEESSDEESDTQTEESEEESVESDDEVVE